MAEYLDMRLKANRGVRANRKKVTLLAYFTWLSTKPDSGITDNPWIGIHQNRVTKRDQYITHKEYEAVAKIVPRKVAALMNLIYCTLQQPQDIVEWTLAKNYQETRI